MLKWLRTWRNVEDDYTSWVETEDGAEQVGRIYLNAHGPQQGSWFWSVVHPIKDKVSSPPVCVGTAHDGPSAKAAVERVFAGLVSKLASD